MVGNKVWRDSPALPMAPMGPLRLAWQQARLQVVFKVGTGQCSQMASVSIDLMTWGHRESKRGGAATVGPCDSHLST